MNKYMGKRLANTAKRMLNQHGQILIISSDLDNLDNPLMEVIGMKSSSDGTGQAEFHIAKQVEIPTGSIIKAKGSNDHWKVIYTEEYCIIDEFCYLKVFTEKIDKIGKPVKPAERANAVFHGPVTGAVQVGGENNTQNVVITINQAFDNAIAELQKHIKSSALDELDKEDALEALERLPQLANKKDSPGILERAKERLDKLTRIIGLSADLYTIGPPLLTVLYHYFSLHPPF